MSASPERPVALVTGAARRIGAAITTHLHASGYDVIIHYRRSVDEAHQLAATLDALRPGSALALSADLARPDDCERLVDEAAGWRGGRLDALVNNASTFLRTPLGTIDSAAWQELIDGNLKAALFCSQAAAPWLRTAGGAIVNICDVRTERPLPQFSVYSAAKAGIVALTRALALELAPDVRVNAVSPGSLDWPEDEIFHAAERMAIEAAIPLARLGSGHDIARAVAFLLNEGPYITGQVLAVDGGASLVSN
ncbi:MAG: pteridine reductase [Burkholderiaceae bacterium]